MLYQHLTQRSLFRSQEDQLFVERRVKNGDMAAHDHDFIEIVVVFKGTGVHHTIHGRRRLSWGDAFILKPGTWHAYKACRQLDYVDCCFGTNLLRRELAWTLEDPALSFVLWNGPDALNTRGMITLKLAPESLNACEQHLEKIRQRNEDSTLAGRLERIGLLIQLIGCLTQDLKSPVKRGTANESGQHIAVTRTVELFEKDLDYPWTLPGLASQLNSIHPIWCVCSKQPCNGLQWLI